MSERKKKQDSETTVEIESEENEFVVEPTEIEVGAGYTLAVNYDENQRPTVTYKTYGQVNLAQVKKEILKIFPDAQIKHTSQTKSVKIVKATRRESKK